MNKIEKDAKEYMLILNVSIPPSHKDPDGCREALEKMDKQRIEWLNTHPQYARKWQYKHSLGKESGIGVTPEFDREVKIQFYLYELDRLGYKKERNERN